MKPGYELPDSENENDELIWYTDDIDVNASSRTSHKHQSISDTLTSCICSPTTQPGGAQLIFEDLKWHKNGTYRILRGPIIPENM